MASVASGEFLINHSSNNGDRVGGGTGGNNNSLIERFVLKKSSLGNVNLSSQYHSTLQQLKHHERGDSGTSRGVEFASHIHTYPFHQNAPSHLLSDQISRDMLVASLPNSQGNDGVDINDDALNDMGPPLSRTLLLAATAAASGLTDHQVVEGVSSRTGSVRSFCSGEAPSDVVAHVDTDDCGGSMSEVSQEDDHKERNIELSVTVDATETMEPQNLGDAQSSVTATTNGRVSPGGTIYKGKGVRRYQGRYVSVIKLAA